LGEEKHLWKKNVRQKKFPGVDGGLSGESRNFLSNFHVIFLFPVKFGKYTLSYSCIRAIPGEISGKSQSQNIIPPS
jgi:hypothetical protein